MDLVLKFNKDKSDLEKLKYELINILGYKFIDEIKLIKGNYQFYFKHPNKDGCYYCCDSEQELKDFFYLKSFFIKEI